VNRTVNVDVSLLLELKDKASMTDHAVQGVMDSDTLSIEYFIIYNKNYQQMMVGDYSEVMDYFSRLDKLKIFW